MFMTVTVYLFHHLMSCTRESTSSRMKERRTVINQKYFQKTGVLNVTAKTERNRTIEHYRGECRGA